MSLRRVFAYYNNLLTNHLYLTQSVQTCALLGLGDFIAQKLVDPHTKHYDYVRTARFAALGLPLGAGLMTWYKILEKVVGQGRGIKFSLQKVALDQVIFSPIMLGIFMSSLTILEGGGIEEIKTRLKKSYKEVMLTNYEVWPAVQIINFSVVPLRYRVLVVQIVALGWNTYLAWALCDEK